MRNQRRLLSVKYIGNGNFINTSWEGKSITFRRGKIVENIPHELLEVLMAENPSEFEIMENKKEAIKKEVKEEKEDIKEFIGIVPMLTPDEILNPVKIKKRGRPFKAV